MASSLLSTHSSLMPSFLQNSMTPPPLPLMLLSTSSKSSISRRRRRSLSLCKAGRNSNGLPDQKPHLSPSSSSSSSSSEVDLKRRVEEVGLWVMEGVYVSWLFFLPYAPGDPVWAIKEDTIKLLLDLSLNFFYVLPLLNSGGIHVMEAPTIHPVSEALFNFVIGWTVLFAPLLFTDCKRKNFKGSLTILWSLQMFLTNTLLIPYMAFRLENEDELPGSLKSEKAYGLSAILTEGSTTVALVGLLVGIVSVLWAVSGRADGGFGSLADRWEFFIQYVRSDRPAYAFIWDICLYSIFQPWLIGDNLQNVDDNRVSVVNYLRFIPYVGLVAYLLCLRDDVKSKSV